VEEREQRAWGGRIYHRFGCGVSGGTSRGKVEGLIREAVEVQASGSLKPAVKSISLSLSVPDSAILSWVIELTLYGI
jgi:hypothetical protein